MKAKNHFLAGVIGISAPFAMTVFPCQFAWAQYSGGGVTIVSTFAEMSQISVTDITPIVSVQVTFLGLSHGRSGDLHILLSHTTTNNINIDVDLFSRPGVTAQAPFGATSSTSGNYSFADSATNTFWQAAVDAGAGVVPNGTYHPSASSGGAAVLSYFTNFTGAAAGKWTLTVSDGASGFDGTLDGWELDIVTVPTLSIALTSTNTAVISWRSLSTGFVLRENADLRTMNWTDVASPVNLINGTNEVVISPLTTNRYFILANP
jgi:hypothetical protein